MDEGDVESWVEMRLKELGICGWRHGRKEWGFKGCDTDERVWEFEWLKRITQWVGTDGRRWTDRKRAS